jgi:hypothetical protein
MTLREFLDSSLRNSHVREPGLEYYVRKSVLFPGAVELASVVAEPGARFGYWRFLKRYESEVPFFAEQVINPALAALYRRRGWLEWTRWGVPQHASPLAVERYGETEVFAKFTRSVEPL